MPAEANRLRDRVIDRAVNGTGHTSVEARRAAFDDRDDGGPGRALVARVAAHAWTVTGEHVAAARIEGLTEDQVFELVICAALGKASRQLRAARAAADEAERIAAPKTQGRDRA